MLDFSILTSHFDQYVAGFLSTIEASLLALICSFVIGTVFAVFRIAPLKVLNIIGAVYVEFFRNIPLLIIAFFMFNGLAVLGLKISPFAAGTIGLSIYTSAFIAEAIRAGIQSVPKGQMEAGRSFGLSYVQTMRYIILPQAVKLVIPPIGNQFLNLIKNSSILSVISGLDLMYYADLVSSEIAVVFDVYIFVAMFYLILTIPLSFGIRHLERRLTLAK